MHATDTTIRPFHLHVPDGELDDLRARLARTRWPQSADDGWARGVPVTYLQELAAYWADGYDWRSAEADLNRLPQFVTEIDGTTVHFLHVRSSQEDALPLVLIHGWPGSIVEFLDVIGPLTDPVGHGGDARSAFHVVIPSIPGFGLSGPTPDTGWTEARVAAAFATLMDRLGYERYGAHGGDVGASVSSHLGRLAPERVVGVHVNAATVGFMPFPPLDDDELAELDDADRRRVQRIEQFMNDEFGYAQIQSTRPQTLSFGLTDSPAGQLAWIIEKFQAWTHDADIPEDAIDRDRLLTNVMLYWLTATAGSAAAIYYETAHHDSWPEPSNVPTGVAVFAEDISIRRYAEALHHITHWSNFDTGGHFAALEAPSLLVGDIRAFFGTVRD